MKGRLLTMLCIPALALGVSACGSTVSTSNFKGEQHNVAQAVADLQSHSSALEEKKVCSEDLAHAIVAKLDRAPGGCNKALETQLKEIDSFETTVESVAIAGAHATARVKSIYGGKNRIQTLTLAKEGGKWRIAGVQ